MVSVTKLRPLSKKKCVFPSKKSGRALGRGRTLPLKSRSDKRHMGRFIEFAEVLEAKIRRDLQGGKASKSPQFPSENTKNDVSPSGMAWLMGQVQVKSPSAGWARRAYGVRAKPRQPHHFDATQAKSFSLMRSYLPEFDSGYSPRELKVAFRRAAFMAHPDQGGSSEAFRELKAAFDNLRQVFHPSTNNLMKKQKQGP